MKHWFCVGAVLITHFLVGTSLRVAVTRAVVMFSQFSKPGAEQSDYTSVNRPY